MRLVLLLASMLLSTLPASQQSQPNPILRVDTDPANSCMKANRGGMWVLESPGLPTINSPVGSVQVTLQRTEISIHPQDARLLYYSISSGQTIQLDCQGNSAVSYSLTTPK